MFSIIRNNHFTKIVFYHKVKEKQFKDILERDYLSESLARSKRTIIELGLCNDWRFFATFTFSTNRKDYELNKNKLLTFFENVKKRKDKSLKYLLIPELHKDKSIHFHALIYFDNAIDLDYLYTDKKTKNKVFYSPLLNKKLGRNNFIPIDQDSPAVSYYISKYISKDCDRIFGVSYFCSKGLNKAERKSFDNDNLANDIKKVLYENNINFFQTEYNEIYQIDNKNLLTLFSKFDKLFSEGENLQKINILKENEKNE